ncbi:TPA: lysozyme inhibitor LprI family protein [Legionella feeleii]
MRRFVAVSGPLFLSVISISYAASYDCQKAGSAIEKMICNDQELSIKDSYLGLLYNQIANTASSSQLTKSQKQWLKERDLCQSPSCLAKTYDQRINALHAMLPASQPIQKQIATGTWLADYSNQYGQSVLEITAVDSKGFSYSIMANNGGNTGELANKAFFMGSDALTIDKNEEGGNPPCQLLFQFVNNKLVVTQNAGCTYYAGNGVFFSGNYVKNGKKKSLNLVELGLLDSKQQEDRFKKLVGNDYSQFISGCGGAGDSEQSNDPKASVRSGFIRGIGPGNCIIMTSDELIWAAVLNSDERKVCYFTNDPNRRGELPSAIQEWITAREKEEGKNIEIIFKSL